jgi:hypothetical protein
MNSPGIKINLDEIITIYSSEDYLLHLLVANPDNYIIVSRETSNIGGVRIRQRGKTIIPIAKLEDKIWNYYQTINQDNIEWNIVATINRKQNWIEETLYYAILISILKIQKTDLKLENLPDLENQKNSHSIKGILLGGGLRMATAPLIQKRIPIPKGSCGLRIKRKQTQHSDQKEQNIANLLIGAYTFDMELIKRFGHPSGWNKFVKENQIGEIISDVSRETLIIGQDTNEYTLLFTDKNKRNHLQEELTKRAIENKSLDINTDGLYPQ